MKSKCLLIIIVLLVLVGIIFIKKSAPVSQNPINNTPEVPTPIVGENLEGEADPDVMKLDMKTWNWISVTYGDGTTITPKNPGKFNLTLKKDGTFSASTDCNGIGGNYEADQNLITFSNMMSTLMFCEGSQEADYRKVLERTASYFFTSRGELILDLKFDSGSATFR